MILLLSDSLSRIAAAPIPGFAIAAQAGAWAGAVGGSRGRDATTAATAEDGDASLLKQQPDRRQLTSGDCVDSDNGANDPYGDGCEDYTDSPSRCGGYDDDDFSSDDMCCACGGGTENLPTSTPAATSVPTTGLLAVTTFFELSTAVAAGGDHDIDVAASPISFVSTLTVASGAAVAIASAVSATLHGGGAVRLFWVDGALTLRSLRLVYGAVSTSDCGPPYTDCGGGGILVSSTGSLVLNDCIMRHNEAFVRARQNRCDKAPLIMNGKYCDFCQHLSAWWCAFYYRLGDHYRFKIRKQQRWK